VLAYGERLKENLVAALSPRQYVFTLPKLIRPFFRYRRRYLGQLCRLVADGVLLPTGTFHVLPPLPEDGFPEAMRHNVLDFLCAEGVLDADLAARMRRWHHSGFSVHGRIQSKAADAEGRQRLARYLIRCLFALNKMSYDHKSGMVIYRSKMHSTLKRNYQLMPALKWLRLLMNHIPDKYEHLIRYYDYYSNRSAYR